MSRKGCRSSRSRPRSTRPRWRAGSAFRSPTFGEHRRIDLAIDGADEVERGTLDLIKGHGGALLREKIVAAASERFIVVVDDEKLVDRLGERFPIPVEIVQFGWQATAAALEKLGTRPELRQSDGRTFVTDGGNFILDCPFGSIAEPRQLEQAINMTVGVVENGLFLGRSAAVVVASADGVEILTPDGRRTGMRRVSLVVTDVDGTLVTHDKSADPARDALPSSGCTQTVSPSRSAAAARRSGCA